jgi:hypothetical protein
VVVVATGVCWAPPSERASLLSFCVPSRFVLGVLFAKTGLFAACDDDDGVCVYMCVCVCARVPAFSLPLSFVRVSCLLFFHTLHLFAGLLWFLWLFPAVSECENPLVAKLLLLLLLLLILLVVGQLLFCTTLWV